MENNNDTSFSRKDWIDYVRVLRNNQFNKISSSASAFKVTSLIVFILFATNQILDFFKVYGLNKVNLFYIMLAYSNISTILLFLFFIFNKISRLSIFNIGHKKFNILEKKCFLYGYFIEILFDFSGFIASFYIYSSKIHLQQYPISLFPYILLSISDFQNLLYKIFIFRKNYFSLNFSRKIIEPYKYDFQKIEKKSNIPIPILIFSYSFRILLNISFLFSCYEIYIKYHIAFENETAFISAFYIFALLFDLQLIALYISNKIKYSWLEYFERDIFLNDLNSNQIKLILNTTFFNTLNEEWIYFDKNNQCNSYFSNIKSKSDG